MRWQENAPVRWSLSWPGTLLGRHDPRHWREGLDRCCVTARLRFVAQLAFEVAARHSRFDVRAIRQTNYWTRRISTTLTNFWRDTPTHVD